LGKRIFIIISITSRNMKKGAKAKLKEIRTKKKKKKNLHKLHNPWDCERLCHKYTTGCHCPLIVRPLCDSGSRRAIFVGEEKEKK
jgi:hypothetical protein